MAGSLIKMKTVEDEGFQTCSITSDDNIYDFLERKDFNPETVLVKKNGKIVPEEEKLENGDRIEIVPIVSGG